jgi:acyl-CoA synthetase (AMP-forming)/AMP-acid ligase II
MPESTLLNELVAVAAERTPDAPALTYGATTLSYGELDTAVRGFASGLMQLGLGRGERVAIYLEKRFETVVASFGAPAAGCSSRSRWVSSCATATCACWSLRPSAWRSWVMC